MLEKVIVIIILKIKNKQIIVVAILISIIIIITDNNGVKHPGLVFGVGSDQSVSVASGLPLFGEAALVIIMQIIIILKFRIMLCPILRL